MFLRLSFQRLLQLQFQSAVSEDVAVAVTGASISKVIAVAAPKVAVPEVAATAPEVAAPEAAPVAEATPEVAATPEATKKRKKAVPPTENQKKVKEPRV